MDNYPFHNFIGALFSYPEEHDTAVKGSGALISPNLVLTVGHALMNP